MPVPTISAAQRRVGKRLALLSLFLGAGTLAMVCLMLGPHADPVALLCWGLAWFLATLAAGAVYAALRFDPPHGRRRCWRCWYDMTATDAMKCPECGNEAPSERALFRTRRATRLLLVSALLLVGTYGAIVAPFIREYGWGAGVPTTMLIVSFPWFGDMPVGLEERLNSRLGFPVSAWQRKLLDWRCRGVIRRSGNLGAIRRAAGLLVMMDNDFTLPEAGPSGQVAVVRFLCSSPNQNANTRLWSEWRLLPDQLDPGVLPQVRVAIEDAMSSGDETRERNAISLLTQLGDDADPYIPALVQKIEDERISFRIATTAVSALHMLAKRSVPARQACLGLLDSASAHTRALGCMAVTGDFPDAVPKLESLLNDAFPEVVKAASAAMKANRRHDPSRDGEPR